MKLFTCASCGNAVHFDNRACLVCGHRLGFLPERATLVTLEPVAGEEQGWVDVSDVSRRFRFCTNEAHDICNWLLPWDEAVAEKIPYCRSCRHNRVVPNLASEIGLARWQRIERAKRYLFYAIIRWNLPCPDRAEDPEHGLVFDFVDDDAETLTGHANGVITLRTAEADDVERERARTAMGEPYRTLIGHFRHESGHFFWDRLVVPYEPILEAFRALFGDERADYAAALKRHYQQGPPADWNTNFISAYACAHPWEDFAEIWAHYLHIVDTLETAAAFGLSLGPRNAEELATDVTFSPYRAKTIDQLIGAWVPVTVALNSIQCSMGQPELYPFVNTPPVIEKLGFVHRLIKGNGQGVLS
jgi:hypothetical protein